MHDFYCSPVKSCLSGSFCILFNYLGSLTQGYENKTPLVFTGIFIQIFI